MTAKECILGRRSIRKFKADPVSHELLAQIVETASYAPSWKHTQITRYIAIEGELKDKIAAEGTSTYPPNGTIISNAPVLIAVTIIKNRSGFERDGSYSTPAVTDGKCMMPASLHRLFVWLLTSRVLAPSFSDCLIRSLLHRCCSFPMIGS